MASPGSFAGSSRALEGRLRFLQPVRFQQQPAEVVADHGGLRVCGRAFSIGASPGGRAARPVPATAARWSSASLFSTGAVLSGRPAASQRRDGLLENSAACSLLLLAIQFAEIVKRRRSRLELASDMASGRASAKYFAASVLCVRQPCQIVAQRDVRTRHTMLHQPERRALSASQPRRRSDSYASLPSWLSRLRRPAGLSCSSSVAGYQWRALRQRSCRAG